VARPAAGYRNAAGLKIPGVTTVLGRFKDSGGLMHWAYKTGVKHGYAEGKGEPIPGANLYTERDDAGTAGNLAHDMIEAHILGKPLIPATSDAIYKQALNGFNQYLEWREQSKMEIVATEQSLVSEVFDYGGTVDAIGRDAKDRIVLLDWKTSNGIYTDYLIQLAAYAILLRECTPWRPEGFHLLRFSKESADFAHHYYGELDDAIAAFPLMVKLYEIDVKLKKRCK
jgi:hypothetical protein